MALRLVLDPTPGRRHKALAERPQCVEAPPLLAEETAIPGSVMLITVVVGQRIPLDELPGGNNIFAEQQQYYR